jgi:hypothetical protein
VVPIANIFMSTGPKRHPENMEKSSTYCGNDNRLQKGFKARRTLRNTAREPTLHVIVGSGALNEGRGRTL